MEWLTAAQHQQITRRNLGVNRGCIKSGNPNKSVQHSEGHLIRYRKILLGSVSYVRVRFFRKHGGVTNAPPRMLP